MTSISVLLNDLLISSSACSFEYASSAFLAWVSLSNSESASILAACALSLACSTAASPSIFWASALDWASAFAWPVLSTAALRACNSRRFLLAFSASASSNIFCLSSFPLASCSSLSASCLNIKTMIINDDWKEKVKSYLAAASCEFVVISIANWTDFCKESRVLWSTGSIVWISILVITRLFCGNKNCFLILLFSSKPKTDALIIDAEFLNKKW